MPNELLFFFPDGYVLQIFAKMRFFFLLVVTYISYSSVYPCFTYFYCWTQNSFQTLHYISDNERLKINCNIQYYISEIRFGWGLQIYP